MIKWVVAAVLLFAMFGSLVSAAEDFDIAISNSEDWKDVYSVAHYANLAGAQSEFLVSTRHGPILIDSLAKENRLKVITSEDRPYVFNYLGQIQAAGFEPSYNLDVESANLELIEDQELDYVENFIVVGSTYGYNAIAVAPYAAKKNAWVFFADRTNIAEIESILNQRDINELIVYGFVDREVNDILAQFDPEVINNGDRFLDNIEIVKKYLEINPTKQVLLTNGDFIEKQVMSGFDPLLFTGKENVPDQIADYLTKSDFEVGVLVGSDLVGAATNIRRSTGISVIVKFARGARVQTAGISVVEGLDLFYVPTPDLSLRIHSAKMNRANSQLEITYKSESTSQAYLKGTITLRSDQGETERFGDVDPIFVAPNDFKTVTYPDVNLPGDKLTAEIFTLYGESSSALDRILEESIEVEFVNVIDGCEIDIDKVAYSKPKDSFIVYVDNVGTTDCWVDAELLDVLIGGVKTNFGMEGEEFIAEGDSAKLQIEAELLDEDLEDNEYIELVIYYGEQESNLVRSKKAKFPVDIITISYLTIFFIALTVIVLILILIVVIRRRMEEDSYY